jgi:uncharacterized alpha-E superfamily protein
MLSRIARALYYIGRDIERAENVARILEVNHKMNLETAPDINVWTPILEAFGIDDADATEAAVYEELVLSVENPHSVRSCIRSARDNGRTNREQISEEVWEHLNRYNRSLDGMSFESILELGRTEFNRQIELFCSAFNGLAHDTMVHSRGWHFLRLGRYLERAAMTCRILQIKCGLLLLNPEEKGSPVDLHQWQALLRSLSAYHPYRSLYHARIVPARVLEFLVTNPTFPRSFHYSVTMVYDSLRAVGSSNLEQMEVRTVVSDLLQELRDPTYCTLMLQGNLKQDIEQLGQRCTGVSALLEEAYFNFMKAVDARGREIQMASQMPQ